MHVVWLPQCELTLCNGSPAFFSWGSLGIRYLLQSQDFIFLGLPAVLLRASITPHRHSLLGLSGVQDVVVLMRTKRFEALNDFTFDNPV